MLYFVGIRKLAAFLGAFCVFTLLAACSSQTPESVVNDYIKAVANNRVDEAVGYFSLEDVKESDLTAAKGKFQMIVGEQHSNMQENGGLNSVSTVLASKDDNTAQVDVEMKFKNGKARKETFSLVKESGKWKVRIG
jgi:hypothetical protein